MSEEYGDEGCLDLQISLGDVAAILTTAPQCHRNCSTPDMSYLIQKSVDGKNQEEASSDASLVHWRRDAHAPYIFISTGQCWTFLFPLVQTETFAHLKAS